MEGSAILLQIRWAPTRACEPGIDAFFYEAQLAIIPPGTYRLTVTHVFPDQSSVALEESVSVP
jgi:hypothetical protein